MSDAMLSLLTRALDTWPLSRVAPLANLAEALESYAAAHALRLGTASDIAMIGLLGVVKETYEDRRLMWYSSRVSTRASAVSSFVEITAECYREQGFEPPLEMLMVTPDDLIAIQKIEWTPGDQEEEARAWQLYETLGQRLCEAGFHPYRLGIQSQAKLRYPERQRRLLEGLKRTFDPNGVIAPGRYGIDLAMD